MYRKTRKLKSCMVRDGGMNVWSMYTDRELQGLECGSAKEE